MQQLKIEFCKNPLRTLVKNAKPEDGSVLGFWGFGILGFWSFGVILGMVPGSFSIRVYGILIEDNRILITDEFRLNTYMTKFPGGALEFGEGTVDCLKREFKEELGMEIEHIEHFYTTDFFQQTELLPKNMQLINIYYRVRGIKPYRFVTRQNRYDFPEIVEGAQSFRWFPLDQLTPEEMTLPIDKRVVPMILNVLKNE